MPLSTLTSMDSTVSKKKGASYVHGYYSIQSDEFCLTPSSLKYGLVWFFNAKSVKIIEESMLDPEKKVFVTYTRNLGYTKVMSVVERVEYRSAGPGLTVARRSAWIDSQVFGFSRAIRAFGVDRFKKNCNQMVSGFNHVLHSMFPRQVASQHSMTHTLKEMREAAAAATDRAKANVLSTVNRT